MMKFLMAVGALGAMFAVPASAPAEAQSLSVTVGRDHDRANHRGGDRRHYGMQRGNHYGWNRGRHRGWDRNHKSKRVVIIQRDRQYR